MIRFGLLGCGRIANRHADLLGDGSVKGAARATLRDNVPERADTGLNQIGEPTLPYVAAEREHVYNARLGLRPEQFRTHIAISILSLPMFAEIAIAQQTALIDLVRTFG